MSDIRKKEEESENEIRDIFPRSCLMMIILTFSIPFLFHGIPDLIDAITRVRINKEYTIEYMDAAMKTCLYNGAQSFVCDPKVVYWNKDTLLVSDGEECYLIELGKRIYNDQMEEIPCGNLKNILWQKPVEVWTED